MQTRGGSDHNRPRTHLWGKFLVVLERGIQISLFTIRRRRKYAISWELWTRWLSIPSSCSRGMERWSKWHWNWARLGNGFKTQGKNIHQLTKHDLKIYLSFTFAKLISYLWTHTTQIRLQIKRVVPRKNVKLNFKDRNVADVSDGYVACISQKLKQKFKHVETLENAMQAVPVLVDNSSQTELRHPKNIYTQYEPRIFTQEEVEKLEKSNEMKKFLKTAVDM